jgi:hypothetical protein
VLALLKLRREGALIIISASETEVGTTDFHGFSRIFCFDPPHQ